FSRFMGRRWHQHRRGICPRCLALERHRLLSLYLREKTNLFSDPLKVLHFAPEFCFFFLFKGSSIVDYTTVDLDSPPVEVYMDITDIIYPDDTFDVILCYHVLEHVPDDRKAIAELYRVLKPGGWAILQSPVNANYEKTFEDPSIVTPEERQLK